MLPRDIVSVGNNSLILDKLSGAATIDAFLLSEIRRLKEVYEKTGDPYPVFLAGLSIARSVESVPESQGSFQFARLLSFLSQMLLNQGKDQLTLSLALEYIQRAIEIIFCMNVVSDEIIKEHIKSALFLGVIQKSLGQFEESILGMRETSKFLTERKGVTKIDLIPLERQEIIMQQSIRGHQKLVDEASQYRRSLPIEYYSTIKRIFEFMMNTGQYSKTKVLFPEYRRAFASVSGRLPPLSHISFLKNASQFYSISGETPRAIAILRTILREARQRNLFGQERQILFMLNEMEAGEKVELVTFYVKNI